MNEISEARVRLPHFHSYGLVQFITFRLYDAIPIWKLAEILATADKDETDFDATFKSNQAIEQFLDEGFGQNWLALPDIGECVQNALFHFDGARYDLLAWVIMPNHVHVLICPYKDEKLSEIVQDWKSFSARTVNKSLNRKGPFWQRNYFDKYMRDEAHYCTTVDYIESNPVKAGLCLTPPDWNLSSAAFPRR